MTERNLGPRLTRRRFLEGTLSAAAFYGVSVSIAGCGSDEGDGGMGTGGCQNPKEGQVGSAGGHGHSIRDVCQSDEGNTITLSLTGSGHVHEITLSSSQVSDILAGTQVMVNSTNVNSHVHSVTFN